AMTSCCVSSSISAILARSNRADRIEGSALAGTRPSSTHASATAISTSSHRSYLLSSDQILPMAGSVYFSITTRLFPFDRRRRLGADVVDDSIHLRYLVHDSIRDSCQ